MIIAICDDERDSAENMKQIIKKYYRSRLTVDFRLFSSGNAFLAAFIETPHTFDIIFLDIQMPGYDGMAVAKTIRKHDESVPIIFFTSHSQYSIQGYDVDAVAYITKPISEESLYRALNKIEKKRTHMLSEHDYLTLELSDSLTRIPYSEIKSVEKSGRHTFISKANGEIIDLNISIRKLENQLANQTYLTLVSYSNYYNLVYSKKYDKRDKVIIMDDGKIVNVSRAHFKKVLDIFTDKYGD